MHRLLSLTTLFFIAAQSVGQGPAAQATLNVTVPQGATVKIADFVSKQTTNERTFFVPNLAPGYTYWYDIEASWTEGGKTRKAAKKVQFKAGATVAVNLTKADAAAVPRVLLITESRGFRHGCVTRKTEIVAKLDPDNLPKIDGVEFQVGKDSKVSAAYVGRVSTTQPFEVKHAGQTILKVTPCVVEITFQELAQKNGFRVTCSQNSRAEITAENLRDHDAVFFYTTGSLPISPIQKSDLLAFVRSGKGFGGSHCATDTFYDWKEYGEMIGGYFDGHPWHQKIKVLVEDQKHPATKHLGESFEITDEIYQFRTPYSRDNLRVLMRLDMGSVKNPGKRQDGDNALAWVRTYDKGRVFYTALGHRDEVWRDDRFQQHVIGGLRFLFGQVEADTKPSGAKN